MSATAEHLHIAPSPDDGLALRYYTVTSADGTRLQAWTNDVEGPTVLLCNGLGTNPYAWPALLDPDCGVRVISWNHRGVGGSDRPRDPDRVGIEAFVEDAVAVLDDAGLASAPVMGWSMGVNTMFELVARHPQRVDGLFAVAGVPGDTFASMGAPIFVPRPLRKPLALSVARVGRALGRPLTTVAQNVPISGLTIQLLSHSGFMLPVADQELTRRAVKELLSTPMDWYFNLAVHTSRHRRVSLSKIDVPAAFVAGHYDLLADTNDMRTAADRIPGATYVELKGTHFVAMEQPAAVHGHLLELLGRIG